jgi:hypothetical protein
MTMNVIQFYSNLLQVSRDPTVLAFLEPKVPDLLMNLAPDADAFKQLLAAETCEFISALRMNPQFVSLDDKYHIIQTLEPHVLNPDDKNFLPALMAFSHILAADGFFSYISPPTLFSFRTMLSTRPITVEKLTSLGIVLSNASNPQESLIREQWFTIPLAKLITPHLRDPTLRLAPITVLSALAAHLWGVKLISSTNDIMEYLQERIGDYAVTTAKFSVLRKMLLTTKGEEERTGVRLERDGALGKWRAHVEIFVSQGEWWRNTVAEVVAEGI